MSGLVSHTWFLAATWVAAIFGGIGIAAAFVSAIVGYQLTEESLRTANEKISEARIDADAKISVAREETKSAVDKAQAEIAKANARSDEANARAAEATQKAAEAQLALEKFKAPRTLSADARAKIAAEMRAFGRIPFVLGVFQDPEPIALMEKLEQSLIAAGWVPQEWKSGGDLVLSRPGRPAVGYTYVIGLYLQADGVAHAADFGPIVQKLAKLISDDGIEAKAEIGRMGPNTNNDHIKILIGQKPR